jgi:hypothetical protein
MDEKKLRAVRAWADEKIASGQEPPWAWYQYMKLIEALDAILSGQSVTTTESSPQLEGPAGKRLQLVDATFPQDSAQSHPPYARVQLPM